MSDFRDAVGPILVCPHCAAQNLPNTAPYLEPQPDGRYLCTICSHVFMPIKESV